MIRNGCMTTHFRVLHVYTPGIGDIIARGWGGGGGGGAGCWDLHRNLRFWCEAACWLWTRLFQVCLWGFIAWSAAVHKNCRSSQWSVKWSGSDPTPVWRTVQKNPVPHLQFCTTPINSKCQQSKGRMRTLSMTTSYYHTKHAENGSLKYNRVYFINKKD